MQIMANIGDRMAAEEGEFLSNGFDGAGDFNVDNGTNISGGNNSGAECGSEVVNGPEFKCDPLRDQDRFLPIANVSKIMKRTVPATGKIAKDAKECVQECVSEFISFITSEAAERCQQEKRKTINGEDILFAMSCLGFDSYIEPLKVYLTKYREANKLDLTSSSVLNKYDNMDGGVANSDYVTGSVFGGSGTPTVIGGASKNNSTATVVVASNPSVTTQQVVYTLQPIQTPATASSLQQVRLQMVNTTVQQTAQLPNKKE